MFCLISTYIVVLYYRQRTHEGGEDDADACDHVFIFRDRVRTADLPFQLTSQRILSHAAPLTPFVLPS